MKKRLLRFVAIGMMLPVVFGVFTLVVKSSRLRERQLVIACWNGNAAQVHRLLESGVNPNAVVRPDIDRPFEWWAHEILDPQDRMIFRMPPLVAAGFANRTDIIDDLLAHGADPNFDDGGGLTALLCVASKDNELAVRHLLEAGANPKARCKDGDSPMDDAHNPAIKALLKSRGG